MKIALAQLDIEWESKISNYKKAEEFTKQASRERCDIVVFPEMFNTGFSMNIDSIAEDEDGETSSLLSELAKGYNINIIAGYAARDRDGKKVRNIAAVFGRTGEEIAKYAKMHPFSFAKEDQYYAAGNRSVLFTIEGMSASIFICYDLRFPEVFRQVVREVQAIFVIANWPAARKEHWNALLKARAIENQCFIIGVNRTGKDANGIDYSGDSNIYDPYGSTICYGDEAEKMLTGEIHLREVVEAREKFPFLRDMRMVT